MRSAYVKLSYLARRGAEEDSYTIKLLQIIMLAKMPSNTGRGVHMRILSLNAETSASIKATYSPSPTQIDAKKTVISYTFQVSREAKLCGLSN